MEYKYKDHRLMYGISGDPNGFPVFINYGLIGDIDLSDLNQMAHKEGLKLIILERPGYGESDFIPLKNYTDWANIVGDFLAHLQVEKLAIVGISAGAPFAYAMANKFAERVSGGVYILSGVPYIIDKAVFEKYKNKKAFYEKIWNYSQQELEHEMYSIVKKYNNFFFRLILPKSIKRSIHAALSNNSSGVAQSVKLQMQDWGFDVYDMPTKINLWHAPKDKEIPIDAVKIMTDKLKNAQLQIKGKGHAPSNEVIKEVFRQIKTTILPKA